MKQTIRLVDVNKSVTFHGHLKREHFDEIANKIKSIPTEDKFNWLIKFLEETNYHIVDVCFNAMLFSDSPDTIVL